MPAPFFKRIRLETHLLEAQREFYACTMNLPLTREGSNTFAVQAGATELEFVQAEKSSEPLYHFALNIPENQIGDALAWTRSRTTVPLRSDGDAVYDFATWHAHAFYFCDPAGNLLEFIARHKLGNASDLPFTSDAIECVSEVGLASADVAETAKVLIDRLGLACYPDPAVSPVDDFQAVGDEIGLFIIAKTGRTWLGSEKSAQRFPAKVWTANGIEFGLTDTYAEIC